MKNPGISYSFREQVINDAEGRKVLVSLLRIIYLTSILVSFLMLILRRFDAIEGASWTDVGLVILLLSSAVSYILLNANRLVLSSKFFLIVTWTGLTFLAGRSAGIKDVSIIGYIILIYLSALLVSYRFALIFGAITIISIWSMAIAQHYQLLIPYEDPPLLYARDFSLFIIMVLASIILFERSFQYSYRRINRELEEKINTEQKLSENEKILLEKNRELTAAKQKAEESDRLKTAFLQNISHEIRTPMNGIMGFAELLKTTEGRPELREEYLSTILECSGQLAAVVNDLIEISRIERNEMDLHLSDFMLDDLLNATYDLFKGRAGEKGILFEVKSELPGINVRSDREKIRQSLNCLVSNAIKFTHSGSVTVYGSADGGKLMIRVSDTGIGISKEDLPVIFDRFRQAETGFERSFGGSGLGLAISKGNVDFLGGSISVKSETGRGSDFIISIPVGLISGV